MKKSVYAFFLALFCVFALSGCGKSFSSQIFEKNAFRIVRQVEGDGEMTLSYVFPVNSLLLKQNGFEEKEIRDYRFFLSNFVEALAKQNADKNVEGTEVSGCTYFSDVDGLGFSVVFENLDAQNRFFEVEDDKSEKDIKKSGFFVRKETLKTTFPMSSQTAADSLKRVCIMAMETLSGATPLSANKRQAFTEMLSDSLYIYDFASTQSGLKSQVMYNGEKFCHNVFIKTYDQLEKDNQIVFWTAYVNAPVWYAAALVATSVVMLAVYFCGLKSEKARKKL